jgi:SAM-dependent methyltransferase
MTDPLAGSPWSRSETVSGFVSSPPNADLLELARRELSRGRAHAALDIGCGAGRNCVPLAQQGWKVVGTDLSMPMLEAARQRVRTERLDARVQLLLAPMDALPIRRRSCTLLIAHGIWNLARSQSEFRGALRDAAGAAAPDAALFVFTFSRNTLPPDAQPVSGETFVYTQFSGQPQVFLTETQLVGELERAGFRRDPRWRLRELNRRHPGAIVTGGPPVIYQGTFRFHG